MNEWQTHTHMRTHIERQMHSYNTISNRAKEQNTQVGNSYYTGTSTSPSSTSVARGWLDTTFMVPWMAESRLLRLNRLHAFGRMLSELATASLEGNQDPKAPSTRGSVGPRGPYLATLRSNPAWRDSGASNGIVRSMIICGVVEVTTTSGRSVVPGKARLTLTVWPVQRNFFWAMS